MKYSIIIPTAFDHLEKDLKPCIESILKYTDLTDVEVIVVSNGCTDTTDGYVQGIIAVAGEKFKLLSFPEALGYAKAVNKGLEIAQGEFIIFLNNDAHLIEQPKNQWLEMLEAPFIDKDTGVTGPLKILHKETNHEFIVFFCAMARKILVDRIGLSEEYGLGYGEDIAFCIEAEKLGYKTVSVPSRHGSIKTIKDKSIVFEGGFPIYHNGGSTVNEISSFQSVVDENIVKLINKYGNKPTKEQLHNDYERAVIDKDEDLSGYGRESCRYKYAASLIPPGSKVLEIGCSSGYGLRFFPPDIDYTGVDYDKDIIEYAKENFAGPNRKFVHSDIHTFVFNCHYDVIVAYEVIEHLKDGKEIAQLLKNYCNKLIISTPYKETPGLWGKHHLLHKLSENDFPEFDYTFISDDGRLIDKPEKFNGMNLMLMKWEKGKSYIKAKPTVLAFIPTKNRYDSLAMTLQSIAMQTVSPTKVLIYDDGEQKDLREMPVYKYIFSLFDEKGIAWSVAFGHKRGQHFGHQLANISDFDLVWRIDDDEVAEPDVLEKLLSHFTPEVGAVGGSVYLPNSANVGNWTNKLEDIYHAPNIQWFPGAGVIEVEHLYSSFVYRTKIANYNLNLSPAAHREETLFSIDLREKGYKLFVDRSAKTYHYRSETGGIREGAQEFYFDNDNKIFTEKMESIGIKLINLDTGYGDHLTFLHVLPLLKAKYKKLIIGCCYPELFKDDSTITVIPVAASRQWNKDNVYVWMGQRHWTKHIIEAYKEMYGV